MSFDTIRRDIENRVADNWMVTPVAYENAPFEEPQSEPWIRVRIFDDVTRRITIGNPATYRHAGLLVLEIFTPKNSGTGTARTYAGTLATLFRDVQFSGLTFREPSLSNGGEENGWFKMNLSTPFFWDGQY